MKMRTRLLTLAVALVVPVSAMAKKVDSGYEYVSQVFDKLQSHWEQQAYDSQQGNALLVFTLNDDGSLGAVKSNSGDGVSAQAAQDFVRKNAPFGPFPSSLRGSLLEFKFKLTNGSLQMVGYNILPRRRDGDAMVIMDNAIRTVDGASVNDVGSPWKSAETQTVDEQAMNDYVAGVQEQIKRHWQWPIDQAFPRTVALIDIDRDGTLLGATIKQTSGNGAVDKAALNTIYQSGPFPAVPKSFKAMPLEVEYVFEPQILEESESGQ